MQSIREILLRRKHRVYLEEACPAGQVCPLPSGDPAGKALVLSMLKNVESLGFTFDRALLEKWLSLPAGQVERLGVDLIQNLQQLVGADREYCPMYPNFPSQVMQLSEAELFLNALFHYWTVGEWLPRYEKSERVPLMDASSLTVLTLGGPDDVLVLFENLLSSKTSLSQQDRDDVAAIMAQCPDWYSHLPETIPLKENVALLGKLVLEYAQLKSANVLQKYVQTATDVLRLVTALSEGDLSLAENTRYRKLKRRERRMVMDLLAECNDIMEDLFRHRGRWLRVGEIVHPFEFRQAKYEAANRAFDMLRNQKKPLFFLGKVEKAIQDKEIRLAGELLMQRPGEFARRLDKLLRAGDDPASVLGAFDAVSGSVSTPVLLQVRQHFLQRDRGSATRIFFPKGNVAKAIVVPNQLPPIDKRICQAVAEICERQILERFAQKAPMGKVFVDEAFSSMLVPFSQRSASAGARMMVRGSKIALKEGTNVMRTFVWWTNGDCQDAQSRVDIDLSAVIYDEDWHYVEHISYTNLRADDQSACHSGDIVDGGPAGGAGAAEFLDVDLDAIAGRGRYVCFQVYNFTKQKYADLLNCRFGWMARQRVDSGEIFEPSTVEQCMDIRAAGRVAVPILFDCREKVFIWCDMNLRADTQHTFPNNLETHLADVTEVCEAMTHLNKPNLYDLICMNANARGTLVSERKEADIVFSNDTAGSGKNARIITAYDVDYIMGQLL